MNENKFVSSSYKFHSIRNLYKGLSQKDISLEISEYGTDTVEIKLINTNYKKQSCALKKQFLYFSLSFTAYAVIIIYKNTFHLLNIDIVFILWLMMLLWRSSHLVEFENVILCHDFGMHMQTQKHWGKHNRFVSASNIHDIVINEVLEDMDCRYLLILRTKGTLFNTKPIICVFKIIKPSYECLSLIYKHLHKMITKKDYL